MQKQFEITIPPDLENSLQSILLEKMVKSLEQVFEITSLRKLELSFRFFKTNVVAFLTLGLRLPLKGIIIFSINWLKVPPRNKGSVITCYQLSMMCASRCFSFSTNLTFTLLVSLPYQWRYSNCWSWWCKELSRDWGTAKPNLVCEELTCVPVIS